MISRVINLNLIPGGLMRMYDSYISYLKEIDFEKDSRVIYIGDSYQKIKDAIIKYKDIFFEKLYKLIQDNSSEDLIIPALLELPFSKKFFRDNITKEEFIAQTKTILNNYNNHINNDYNSDTYFIEKALEYNKNIVHNFIVDFIKEYILTREILFDSIPDTITNIKVYIDKSENMISLASLIAREIFNNSYDAISFSSKLIYRLTCYINILNNNTYEDIINNNIIEELKLSRDYFSFRINVTDNELYNILSNRFINPMSRINYVTGITADNKPVLLLRLPCAQLDVNPSSKCDDKYQMFFKIIDSDKVAFIFQDLLEMHAFTTLDTKYFNCYFDDYSYYFDQFCNDVYTIYSKNITNKNYINKEQVKHILFDNFIHELGSSFYNNDLHKLFNSQLDHGSIKGLIDIYFDYNDLFLYDPAINNMRLIQGCIIDKDNSMNFNTVFYYETTNNDNYSITIRCSIQRTIVYTQLIGINTANKTMSNECYRDCLRWAEIFKEFLTMQINNNIIDKVKEIIDRNIVDYLFRNKPAIYYNGNLQDFLIELQYYYNVDQRLEDFEVIEIL